MAPDPYIDLAAYDETPIDLGSHQVVFEPGQTKNYQEDEVWSELWTAANSSNVGAFRRAGKRGIDLQVWFLNGRVYEYLGAGPYWESMNNAPSKGKWVWQYLRRGNFLYQQIWSP